MLVEDAEVDTFWHCDVADDIGGGSIFVLGGQ